MDESNRCGAIKRMDNQFTKKKGEKMRKTIFIIALFLLVNMNVTFAGSNQNSSFAGNSTGNLNNDGFYASKGEWIYYRSFSSAGGLYKVKKMELKKQN